MAADIVNLKLYKKIKAREQKEREAEANRAKHGRPKVERLHTEAEEARQRERHDAGKREDAPDKDGQP